MNELTVFTSDVADLSVAQLAALPGSALQEVDVLLTTAQAQLKLARGHLDAALEQRFGEQARIVLRDSGRDFGVTHVTDGDLRVTFELPKRVSWDQKKLAAMAERIAASGERVQDYLDVELSVSESRFNNWPPMLKEQFAAARTVKAGKAAFRLALTEEVTP